MEFRHQSRRDRSGRKRLPRYDQSNSPKGSFIGALRYHKQSFSSVSDWAEGTRREDLFYKEREWSIHSLHRDPEDNFHFENDIPGRQTSKLIRSVPRHPDQSSLRRYDVHKKYTKRKSFLDGHENTKNEHASFCVYVTTAKVLIFSLVAVALTVGLIFGLKDKDKVKATVIPTREVVLTFLIDAEFGLNLLDQSSAAYAELRTTIIEGIQPLCQCSVESVAFYNGSIGVRLEVAVPDTVPTTTLQQRLVEGAQSGTLLPGYSIVTSSITVAEPDMDPPTTTSALAGTWMSWSPWSLCSVTCGGGRQKRSRTCPDDYQCLGTPTQEQRCNEKPCPRPAFALWSSWQPWSVCTSTCGGGDRKRTRTCTSANLRCVGTESQSETCNTFECPDCNTLLCRSGTTKSPNCTHCICLTHTYSGMVVDVNTGLLLPNVAISPRRNPDVILRVTGSNGRYTLTGPCGETELVFTKDGYVTTYLKANDTGNKVFMQKRELLEIVVNPLSKQRLVGENVTLCCAAKPTPKYFEWFKDDNFYWSEKVTDNYTGASHLVFTALSLDDKATYRCRANDDSGAIKSATAQLSIEERRDDFCLKSPSPKHQQLPPGCLNGNDTSVNVGECPREPCRSDDPDNGQCGEGVSFCCGPTAYTPLSVPCNAQILTFNVITACGCRPCIVVNTFIKGVVVRFDDNRPVNGSEIWHNGERSGITDEGGNFNFTVDEKLERISMNIRLPYGSDLTDTTQTLTVVKTATGVFFITIRLLPKSPPMHVNSEMAINTTVHSSNTNTTLGKIFIPPGAFYDNNGDQFEGEVDVAVTGLVPQDPESSEVAPGDFTTSDTEGNQQTLSSIGLFKIDVSGGGENLQAPGEINITITADIVGNETDENGYSVISVWSINPSTGRWELEDKLVVEEVLYVDCEQGDANCGKIVFKAVIKGVPVQGKWVSFGSVSDSTCYSKIRVFESDEQLQINEESPVEKVSVGMIILSEISGNTVSYTRALTDVGDRNGYCIAHTCHESDTSPALQGRIFADKFGKILKPLALSDLSRTQRQIASSLDYDIIDNTLAVNLDLSQSENSGPFYTPLDPFWRYSVSCSFAPISDMAFTFKAERECDFAFPNPLLPDVWELDKETCVVDRLKQLYGFPSVLEEDVEACYIKVYVPTGTMSYNGVDMKAISRVGAANNNHISPGTMYGFSQNCIRNEFACLEIKVPGSISCSTVQQDHVVDHFTHVTLEAVHINSMPPVHQLNPYFSQNPEFQQMIHVANESFVFSFTSTMKNEIFGIFCDKLPSIEGARTSAKVRCQNSDRGKWAVQFAEPRDTTTSQVVTTTTSQVVTTTTSQVVTTTTSQVVTTTTSPVVTTTTSEVVTTDLTSSPQETTEAPNFILTYNIEEEFQPELLDVTSQAYLQLRDQILEGVEPVCQCTVTSVRFSNGSIVVELFIVVPDTVSVFTLVQRVQEAAHQGTLLPGQLIDEESIGVRSPLPSDPTTITPSRTFTRVSTVTTQMTTDVTTNEVSTTTQTRNGPTTDVTTAPDATTGYSDIVILHDVSGSMQGILSTVVSLFQGVFSALSIGEEEHKIAYHTVYDSYGWSLNSPLAATSLTANDVFNREISEGTNTGQSYHFSDSSMFDKVLRDIIQPGDRSGYPNIVFVIWDGDNAPSTNNLAQQARIISLGYYNFGSSGTRASTMRSITASDADVFNLETVTSNSIVTLIMTNGIPITNPLTSDATTRVTSEISTPDVTRNQPTTEKTTEHTTHIVFTTDYTTQLSTTNGTEDAPPLDIVVVLDATGSMTSEEAAVLDFMIQLLGSLLIGTQYTKVAMVTFHSSAVVKWDFNSDKASNSSAVLSGLDNLIQSGGGFPPYDAFLLARSLLDQQGRPQAMHLVVFIYDGQESTNNAFLVRSFFERMIVVGTPSVNWSNAEQFNPNEEERFTIPSDTSDIINYVNSLG